MESQTGSAALIRVIVAGSGPQSVPGVRGLSFGTFASAGNFCTINSFLKTFYPTQGKEFSWELSWNRNCHSRFGGVI
jgi:hypothetical protein